MKWIDENPMAASLNYLKGQVLTRLGLRGHFSGSTARALQAEAFVAYARQAVEDYALYGAGGRPDPFRGAAVLEIGPGDNLAVALLLLARGAESVTCVDAFHPAADTAENRRIYQLLMESLSPAERASVEQVAGIGPQGELTIRNGRLTLLRGTPVETLGSVLADRYFDIILSRAVLEHTADPARAWDAMRERLKPGGEMWHKIDFRSHNFYNAIHPLYFLTIPETLWRVVSSPDPTLNRQRLAFYREAARRAFPSTRIFATRILEHAEILPHVPVEDVETYINDADMKLLARVRPNLLPELRAQSAVDLLVGGVFMTCKSPLN